MAASADAGAGLDTAIESMKAKMKEAPAKVPPANGAGAEASGQKGGGGSQNAAVGSESTDGRALRSPAEALKMLAGDGVAAVRPATEVSAGRSRPENDSLSPHRPVSLSPSLSRAHTRRDMLTPVAFQAEELLKKKEKLVRQRMTDQFGLSPPPAVSVT